MTKIVEILNISNPSRVTIQEVARMAGVSVGTVSAAFNNRLVGERTKKKVLSIAEKVGYRPNTVARSMVTRKTRMLGLLMPWNNVELTDAATVAAADAGYSLMVCFAGSKFPGGERGAMEHLMERMADGIIYLPLQDPAEDYARLIAGVRSKGTEIVTVDRYFREIKVDSVVTNNLRAGELVAEHFISLGHREMMVLICEQHTSTIRDRLQGFGQALRRAGIPFGEDCIFNCGFPLPGSLENIVHILSTHRTATAVFASNDHIAYDVMRACRQIGRRIPEDFSLVGFDDMLLGAHRIGDILQPPLTTVRQNFTDMVSRAVEILIGRIEKKTGPETRITYIEPELIVRNSTQQHS